MLKVAERWFERRAMGEGVTLIWEPHLNPFIRCNIWHVRGRSRDLIVDTGSGLSPLRRAIADLIDRPLAAVATHIHYDHVGGLHEFDERMMHHLEAPRMSPYREFHPLRASEFPESFRPYLPAASTGASDLLLDARPTENWTAGDYAIASTTPTRRLAEGDVIEPGRSCLRGHALARALAREHRSMGATHRSFLFRRCDL
jgi:glyoxylase-like metal-dependent hydrolase (beta-lactamase superfamily II)